MCNIARTVPGVLGERMLGGGDKGAAGAIAKAGSEQVTRGSILAQYRHPEARMRICLRRLLNHNRRGIGHT